MRVCKCGMCGEIFPEYAMTIPGHCAICNEMTVAEITKTDTPFSPREIEQIWWTLEDVGFDGDDEVIEEDWFGFPKGTSRMEIWHWFDEHYYAGVHALLYMDNL